MRIKILKSIIDDPKNANQISKDIDVNYRTIEHHLKLLSENKLIMAQGEGYGKVYFVSSLISENMHLLKKVFNETEKEGVTK